MRGQRVARCGEPLSVLEQQGGFALLTGDGPVLVLVGGLLTGWRGLPKAQCDGGVVERYEGTPIQISVNIREKKKRK